MPIILRRKRFFITGILLALLFAVMLSLRIGLFEKDQINEGRGAYLDKTVREEDAWMSISQGEGKIGYARRRLIPAGRGYRMTEEVSLRINAMGVYQPLQYRMSGELDGRLRLLSFNFDLNSSIFRFASRGTVRGKVLTILSGPPGEESKMEIPLKSPVHLAASMFSVPELKNMRPGESRSLQVFDPVVMGERPVAIRALKYENIVIKGENSQSLKVSMNFMGAEQTAWIGAKGDVLMEKGALGLTLEKTTESAALEGIKEKGGVDLVELASIEANRAIPSPVSLFAIRVRVLNAGNSAYFLNGGRQVYRDNVVTIRKEQPHSGGAGGRVRPSSHLLRPSPLIQSDHHLIVRKAREITAGVQGNYEKSKLILEWIYKNVRKRPVFSIPNALDTLMKMEGDCNEHAVLFAALARAAGIPADIETGVVYLRGRFYYHAWNVVYLGDWVTADGALGQFPADVTHIRFARGIGDGQTEMLALVGRLRLEIMDFS